MPLLFSYGTLQLEPVQLSTFGRRLEGRQDELSGFTPSTVRIDDPGVARALGRTHHANVTPGGEEGSRVPGVVFEVTDAELAAVDRYEAEFAYRRIEAILASGRCAWVYLHADAAPG